MNFQILNKNTRYQPYIENIKKYISTDKKVLVVGGNHKDVIIFSALGYKNVLFSNLFLDDFKKDMIENREYMKIFERIKTKEINMTNIPFEDNSFDCVTMAFGLRNVTFKENCLASVYAKLKPAGKFIVLEFSQPDEWLQPLYEKYSFSVLPWLGRTIAKDEDSYRYLAESIRMHPDQATLKNMFMQAGFDDCRYVNLNAGIVAAHIGYKY